ncbi:hypothetical protein C8J57DRAFT_1634410 [Mycena rebaudengoi]|nr:hypothetical protein C8J57DRAFT_1634410 [Mycena rebaudengoi]
MRVPQEIVDTIIDHLLPIDSEDDGRETRVGALRACALTCRSFLPRSQTHLFATIRCLRSGDVLLFDRLLAGSPYIGSLYVRYFSLVGVPGDFSFDVVPDSIMVSRILSLLPNLARLDVVSVSDPQIGFPTAVEGAFSLLSLRTLQLSRLSFTNAAALDSLLRHARALQDLSLEDICFGHHPVDHTGPASRGVAVALASLRLHLVRKREVDAMLAAFSAVDIRHLLSLEIQTMSSPGSLLAANAHTIQRVRYPLHPRDVEDPEILIGNRSLQFIEVIEPNADMTDSLMAFGNLRHLTALRTISLHFDEGLDDFPLHTLEWGQLDAILAQAGSSLEDVRLYAFAEQLRKSLPNLAAVRSWLPSVAGLISIHMPMQIR